MPDWLVYVGPGVLLFVLMVGWLATVARATSTPIPKTGIYAAAALSSAIPIFMIIIEGLHLTRALFGWMVR